MADNLKQAYEEKQEARIQELEATVNKLRAEAQKNFAEAKITALTEAEKRQREARDRLDELKKAGSDAWGELRDGLDSAADELAAAVKSASQKIQGDDN